MPRVIFVHAVSDVDHWASKHSNRVQAFSAWGTNVVDYLSADGGNTVGVSVDVHDMDAMKTSMATTEMAAAKAADGVLEPISMFVETS